MINMFGKKNRVSRTPYSMRVVPCLKLNPWLTHVFLITIAIARGYIRNRKRIRLSGAPACRFFGRQIFCGSRFRNLAYSYQYPIAVNHPPPFSFHAPFAVTPRRPEVSSFLPFPVSEWRRRNSYRLPENAVVLRHTRGHAANLLSTAANYNYTLPPSHRCYIIAPYGACCGIFRNVEFKNEIMILKGGGSTRDVSTIDRVLVRRLPISLNYSQFFFIASIYI